MIHYAAGILPVTRHEGTTLFLVGQDVRDRSWSDFGGKCERVDKHDPLTTACREFYEETYGCVLDYRSLRHRLAPANCLALRSRTQNNHPYWMFVVEMPYQAHLRNSFQKAFEFLKNKHAKLYVEKTDLRWVTLQELRSEELVKRSVFRATVEAHIALLQRVAAGEPWARLCAEHAAMHASCVAERNA